MTKSTITKAKWTVETTDQTAVIKHSLRSGNDITSINFEPEEFVDLYSLIMSLAQLHPEWLNTQ
jgi:hypothetical protein